MLRTDRNNNPIAFTTDIAAQAGLKLNTDFAMGDSFVSNGHTYYTAKLLTDDPVKMCIDVIDKIGFYTQAGSVRWIYIGIPDFIWKSLDGDIKKQVIGFMYSHEGGTEMEHFFE